MRLPAAGAPGWAVRRDHCFMRICLDNALGRRWDEVARPPAIRTLPDADLARAADLAQAILDDPSVLPELNARSLAWRGRPPPRRLKGAG